MPMKTSETEIKHLLIAWLAISFAFTVLIKRRTDLGSGLIWPEVFIISAVTVGFAFIFHELAHKVVAQRYGAWSEFRMAPFMLLVAILTAFMGFIFAAPGAVMIFSPYLTREENGKIAIAGPMTNVALAFLFLPLTFYSGMLKQIGDFGVMINALLAVFNMIPISVLDGKKVLAWDRRVYSVALGIAIIVLMMSMIVRG
ncbi:MAG: site-2 protease family protein [Candidatus Syntrophoarchaeum sp.]|nr:site-2 protease family protein [Methanomicrobia archaeon]MBL7117528.1 site-2 protease family protein [Candidatus Syntrophoarchaeum sp.]